MHRNAADDVIALYHRHAGAFAEARDTSLLERNWLDAFLDRLPAGRCGILDLGCGTGQPIAAHLLARGCRVTGIDGAAAMIERARRSFPDQGWILADMRRLPLRGLFRGIVAWHSLFHLPPEDQRAMFRTFAHMSAAGAPLLFTSGRASGVRIGQFAADPLYHASLDGAEYRDLLAAEGFELLRHVEADPDCGGATVWLAQRLDPAPAR